MANSKGRDRDPRKFVEALQHAACGMVCLLREISAIGTVRNLLYVSENPRKMGEVQIQAPERELAEIRRTYEGCGGHHEAPVHPLGAMLVRQRGSVKSRMMGDYHVRFRERLGVRFPRPTRLNRINPLSRFMLLAALAYA